MISKKRPSRALAELLLEPKPIKVLVIRFVILFILAGVVLGTALPFLANNWALYLTVIGAAIGVFSLVQLGYIVSYSKRDKKSYLLNKEGLYITEKDKSIEKYPWKQISNISIYVPKGRFTHHQCLIEKTAGSITLDLSHYIEKHINLKTSAHIAQAITMLYNQRIKNLKKRVLGIN